MAGQIVKGQLLTTVRMNSEYVVGVRVHRRRRRVGASKREEEVAMVIFRRRENSGRAELVGL